MNEKQDQQGQLEKSEPAPEGAGQQTVTANVAGSHSISQSSRPVKSSEVSSLGSMPQNVTSMSERESRPLRSKRDLQENIFGAIRDHFRSDWSSLAEVLLGPPTKRTRQEWRYLCPLHSEDSPSFDFNVEKGLFHCFGCGESGDAIELWAKLRGQDLKEAALQICQVFGIPIEEEGKPLRLTLAAYASAKRLDLQKLKGWGLKDGEKGLEIPYIDEKGQEVAVRIRLAMRGEDRFRWEVGAKPILYGLWRLGEWQAAKADRVYLVEGESDVHTLWQAGLPALGLPGKTIFKPEWAKFFRDFEEVVIVEEPRARKEVLQIARALTRGNGPKVYALHLPVKDPSELWLASPDPEAFKSALEDAERESLDFTRPSLKAEWLCLTQEPISYRGQFYRLPYPYLARHGRLYQLQPGQRELRYQEILPRLLIIGGRYRDEKGQVWTELAWQEEGSWQARLIARQEALDRKFVLDLAKWGAPISSENASAVVKFLAAFEEENQALLQPREATTHMGWVKVGETFLLGEKAIGGEVRFIPLGEEEERLCEAYKAKGREEEWKRLFMGLDSAPASAQAKFIVAASFAAPLVRLLGERSSLVYLYGETRIGKTALLHLALSAWGDPFELRGTAFSTSVGLERRAALFSDLPLAIDERQAATSEQFVNQAVYMLSGGQAKGRGQREGGLQAIAQWRSVILMTGEQDLTSSVWTGLETRTLQLHLLQLLDEAFSREIYKVTRENYGHIGPRFIEKVLAEGRARIEDRYRLFEEALKAGKGGEAIGGAKLALFALVGTAHQLLLETLGGSREEAFQKALANIGEIQCQFAQVPQETLAERARDYILSKFAEFQADLKARGGTGQDERAFVEEDGEEKLYVLPSVFEDWLAKGGFTKKRVLQDFDSKGWIVASQEGGKKRYTLRKRSPELWAKLNRYYCLRLSRMEGISEHVPTSEEDGNVR